MKQVKVSELKAHLSEYLRAAEAGETVLVCDRERPVAQLTRVHPDQRGLRLRPPRRRTDLRAVQGVPPNQPVDVVALLREDRDRR